MFAAIDGGWWENLRFALEVVIAIFVAYRALSGRGEKHVIEPNPLVVTPAEVYASKSHVDSEVAQLRSQNQQFDQKLSAVERALREEIRRDVAQLHEKLNSVAIQVGSVQTATDAQNVQFLAIAAKLDRLVERLIPHIGHES